MPVRKPTHAELSRIAEKYDLHLEADELGAYEELIATMLPAYAELERLPEPRQPVSYARSPGCRPSPEENPLNAWYGRCSIQGAAGGKLSGKRIVRAGIFGH